MIKLFLKHLKSRLCFKETLLAEVRACRSELAALHIALAALSAPPHAPEAALGDELAMPADVLSEWMLGERGDA
ncbi:hypothetical protein LJB77_01460 [Ruminococcaceae bacterium OttesenSCG-928-N02]|nr:hypothetical protein [Ruminococcaceae bacterium OttesenSCG-928-N02]